MMLRVRFLEAIRVGFAEPDCIRLSPAHSLRFLCPVGVVSIKMHSMWEYWLQGEVVCLRRGVMGLPFWLFLAVTLAICWVADNR